MLLLNYHTHIWCLSLSQLSQTSDSGSDRSSSSCRNSVCTTSNDLLTGATLPDTGSLSLDSLLTAEGAVVSRMLLNFELLALSSQRRTVSDTVFTSDSDFLSSLRPILC